MTIISCKKETSAERCRLGDQLELPETANAFRGLILWISDSMWLVAVSVARGILANLRMTGLTRASLTLPSQGQAELDDSTDFIVTLKLRFHSFRLTRSPPLHFVIGNRQIKGRKKLSSDSITAAYRSAGLNRCSQIPKRKCGKIIWYLIERTQ